MLAARSSAVREKKIAAASVFKHLRRCTCRARSASFHALAGGAPRPCTHLHRCRAHCAVIDAFTTTWGPCEMVASYFSNYYFDLGEELGLKFIRAQTNGISDLKEYKDKSDSTFLFYLVRASHALPLPSHGIPLTALFFAVSRARKWAASRDATSRRSRRTSRRTRRRPRRRASWRW